MRLLHMRLSGQLTENQWSALLNLKSHKDKLKITDTSFWPDVDRACQDIKIWANTNVEQDVLEDLICIVRIVLFTSLQISRSMYPFLYTFTILFPSNTMSTTCLNMPLWNSLLIFIVRYQ